MGWQTPSGKFPIRTYITADVTEQYQCNDPQGHTWWIPDEQNNLQAWSLMYNTIEAPAFPTLVPWTGVGTCALDAKSGGRLRRWSSSLCCSSTNTLLWQLADESRFCGAGRDKDAHYHHEGG